MQFCGPDARLTVLTERTAQTARFDRTENVRLEDARSGRSIREGQRRDLAHVFHTVAEPMIRNVAPAMVTEVFTPAQGAGWQGLRKQQRQRELDNCNKKVVRARSAATAPSLDGGQKGSHIATVTFDASLRSWVTPLPPNLYRDRATNV